MITVEYPSVSDLNFQNPSETNSPGLPPAHKNKNLMDSKMMDYLWRTDLTLESNNFALEKRARPKSSLVWRNTNSSTLQVRRTNNTEAITINAVAKPEAVSIPAATFHHYHQGQE